MWSRQGLLEGRAGSGSLPALVKAPQHEDAARQIKAHGPGGQSHQNILPNTWTTTTDCCAGVAEAAKVAHPECSRTVSLPRKGLPAAAWWCRCTLYAICCWLVPAPASATRHGHHQQGSCKLQRASPARRKQLTKIATCGNSTAAGLKQDYLCQPAEPAVAGLAEPAPAETRPDLSEQL